MCSALYLFTLKFFLKILAYGLVVSFFMCELIFSFYYFKFELSQSQVDSLLDCYRLKWYKNHSHSIIRTIWFKFYFKHFTSVKSGMKTKGLQAGSWPNYYSNRNSDRWIQSLSLSFVCVSLNINDIKQRVKFRCHKLWGDKFYFFQKLVVVCVGARELFQINHWLFRWHYGCPCSCLRQH